VALQACLGSDYKPFNSLSRDHIVLLDHTEITGTSFNSLSRDHKRNPEIAKVLRSDADSFNSLSRDHDHELAVRRLEGREIPVFLSTPSLGITKALGCAF
jgi:hypothetical protein